MTSLLPDRRGLIAAMIVISVFNAKCPHCNNFILR